jgi:hypothetical protein
MRGIMPWQQEASSPCCIWAQFMPFSLYYSHYITIICYYTHYFKTQKFNLGAYSLQKTGQLAHPPQGISKHANQEHQQLHHQAPPMEAAAANTPPG